MWAALTDLWTYAANRVPEISDTVVEIDRAMKLGFNWEMGPFELWDAAGVEATVARMKKEGKPVAANAEKLLASGQKTWYTDDPKSSSGREYFDLSTGTLQPVTVPEGVWSITVAKKASNIKTLADLKGTLLHVMRALYGPDRRVRFLVGEVVRPEIRTQILANLLDRHDWDYVIGSVHFLTTFDLPLALCCMAMTTRLAPEARSIAPLMPGTILPGIIQLAR